MTASESKSRNIMQGSRLMMVSRALAKAGGVAPLSKTLGISTAAIYSWCDFSTGPSNETLEKIHDYLSEKAPVTPPTAQAKSGIADIVTQLNKKAEAEQDKNYNRPTDMQQHEVTVLRHAFAKNGSRIIFGTTGENEESVFIPPHTTERMIQKLGVVPIGLKMKMMISRDISGRSAYIAQDIL